MTKEEEKLLQEFMMLDLQTAQPNQKLEQNIEQNL